MTTNTVTGTAYHPSTAEPLAAAIIRFRLAHRFVTSSGVFLPVTISVTTSVNGTFSVTLAVPDSGATEYICFLPEQPAFRFSLAAGQPTTLEALIAAGPSLSVSQSSVVLALDVHEAAANQHSFLRLDDTPNSYTGQANKVVTVASDASGLAFSASEDVATQIELDAHIAETTDIHGIADAAALVLATDVRLVDARAPLAHTQAWGTITGTPTTQGGYGIVDGFTQVQADALYRPIGYVPSWGQITGTPTTLAGYNISDGFTEAEADALYRPIAYVPSWSEITSKPTTLAGYAISDAFTQTAADALYRPIGYVPAWSEITGKPTTIAGYGITDPIAYTNAANVFSVAQGVRVAASGQVAGLYVPWVSGDTLTTMKVGASTAGNDRVAIEGYSNSSIGVYGQSSSLYGVQGASTNQAGVIGTSTNSTGVAGTSTNGRAFVGASAAPSLAPMYLLKSAASAGVVTPMLEFYHNTAAGGTTGLGSAIDWYIKTTTTADVAASRIATLWTDATHASRTSAITFSTVSLAGALTEAMRIAGNGFVGIGQRCPITFSTVNNAGALTEVMRLTGAGAALHRSTDATQAAGLYVPWISGDALPTLKAGSATAGNNQIGVFGISDSSEGVRGTSAAGTGVNGVAGSGVGVFATSTSGNAFRATTAGVGAYVVYAQATGSTTIPLLGYYSGTPAATTTVNTGLYLLSTPGNTPANGAGIGILTQLKSSTTAGQDASRIDTLWTDATHASRTSAITFSTVNNAGALTEAVRIAGNGFVGIGATVPDQLLHLSAAQALLHLTSTTGTNRVGAYFSNTGGAYVFAAEGSGGGGWLPGTSPYALAIGVSGAYPIQFSTSNAVRMTIASTGALLLRSTDAAQAAGLYVPWVSGDTLATATFGAATAGNGLSAIIGRSDSYRAIQGVSVSGTGLHGESTSGFGLSGVTASAAGAAGYFQKGAATGGAVSAILDLYQNTAAGGTTGLGAAIDTYLKSTTSNSQAASRIATLWTDATHATRTSAITFSTVSLAGALTERSRFDAGAGADTTGLVLWDVNSGATKRVQVGAADSGGAGWRLLRIVN